MKVLSINPMLLREQPPVTTEEPKLEQKPCEGCYTTSVFSKGMSGLAFGMAARVRTCFEKEIAEQPKVLEKLSKKFFPKKGGINLDLNISPVQMSKVKRIMILASGSSKNAGEMARSFLEDVTGLPVIVESASEYMDKKNPQLNKDEDLGIFISQSGKTADTLKALRTLRGKDVNTVAITNNPHSLIAETANSHIFIDAGEENAVAATKTVTSSIYSLMALGVKLHELQEKNRTEILIDYLRRIPDDLRVMLKDKEGVKQAAKIIANADNIYLYAKGSNIGAVNEGALKLTETTGKRVISGSSTEALHGTFASIKPDNPVLQVIAGDRYSDLYLDAFNDIKEIVRKRNVKNPIIIKHFKDFSPEDTERRMNLFNAIYINIPENCWEAMTPFYTTVRMQQITNEVTKKLWIDPDNGGGFLTKYRSSVTM